MLCHLHSLHLDPPGVAGHAEHLQHGVGNLLSEIDFILLLREGGGRWSDLADRREESV